MIFEATEIFQSLTRDRHFWQFLEYQFQMGPVGHSLSLLKYRGRYAVQKSRKKTILSFYLVFKIRVSLGKIFYVSTTILKFLWSNLLVPTYRSKASVNHVFSKENQLLISIIFTLFMIIFSPTNASSVSFAWQPIGRLRWRRWRLHLWCPCFCSPFLDSYLRLG